MVRAAGRMGRAWTWAAWTWRKSRGPGSWPGAVRTLVAGWQFFRGFVEAVWLDAATFLAKAPELYRRAPVLQLYLSGAAPVAGQLFALQGRALRRAFYGA